MIVSVASDETLAELMVLKGGNALALIHKIGSRASLELDFSLEGDFLDPNEIGARLFRALRDRFDSAGLLLFDEEFGPKPRTARSDSSPKWGGYKAAFKLISKEEHKALKGDLDAMRRQSQESGPGHRRVFEIEISKFEYCAGNVVAEIDAFPVRVYTPAMIAIEKLRAICQQMSEYIARRHPAPRARDFYDIHAIVTTTGVELAAAEQGDLIRSMFSAKEVPLALLSKLEKYREFHRQDWPAVEVSVSGELQPFDYYYDFVLTQAKGLEALWIE